MGAFGGSGMGIGVQPTSIACWPLSVAFLPLFLVIWENLRLGLNLIILIVRSWETGKHVMQKN